MRVNNDNGSREEEGALAALLPIPCPLLWWFKQQQREQLCTTTTVAAVQTTVPWHHWLFLAHSCSGVDGSSMDEGA